MQATQYHKNQIQRRYLVKIILKYIITNVKERKLRSGVMLLSILLSTTLLFVSFSIGASYESVQKKMARGMAGSAALSVSSPSGAVTSQDIPDLPAIGAAVGILKGAALYHENGYYETIDLIAADLPSLNKINPPRLTEGGELSDFEGDRILLPDRFTSKYGIQTGDDFSLWIEGTPVTLEVAANRSLRYRFPAAHKRRHRAFAYGNAGRPYRADGRLQ